MKKKKNEKWGKSKKEKIKKGKWKRKEKKMKAYLILCFLFNAKYIDIINAYVHLHLWVISEPESYGNK